MPDGNAEDIGLEKDAWLMVSFTKIGRLAHTHAVSLCMMEHKHSNELIHETSPYLLQHAHNPVKWHPWGTAALQKARAENKIILVSIGYSACHWCHVMERESFEDETTAALMNEHFINIKIDREERPDIDQVYMDAVQAMTGSGGWPLNVFLTPEAKPFYGGTYFPPVKAFNRASWTDVLTGVINAWNERRSEVEAQAENLTAHISKGANFTLPLQQLVEAGDAAGNDFETCNGIFAAIMQSADTEWGGFGRAPKFPQTFCIQFLLQYHHYSDNPIALEHALRSIDKMLDGGIYDHLAGGLARYSTDNEWLAPHFEKMLYDNALLILVLCDAFQLTKQPRYRLAIEKTMQFIQTEMLHPAGGFYAALDADSEGEEGKYYVWQKEEIESILGTDAGFFCDFFDVTENGNWEHKNILRILKPVSVFVKEKGLNETEFVQQIDNCIKTLKSARDKRTSPGLDDKILLGWNALMLKAIARAAVVLQDENYKALALNNFKFITEHFTITDSDAGLKHTWKNGEAKHPAFLDDYAYLADACIGLYELTFDTDFLTAARKYCSYAVEHFSDAENLFFYFTHKNQEDIIVRKKEIYDGAIPSANAVMASNLFKLAVIFDDQVWFKRSGNMLQSIAPAVQKYPASFAKWACSIMQKISGPAEIAIIGKEANTVSKKIQELSFMPGAIIMSSELKNDDYPLLRSKGNDSATKIYICKNYMCNAPLSSIDEFIQESKKHKI